MGTANDIALTNLGFKPKKGSAHMARTMMLQELTSALAYVGLDRAGPASLRDAIEEENCLSKRSAKTRTLTYRHLQDLYGLDPALLTFRGLLHYWERDERGQPLLALTASLARDPLLRSIVPDILDSAPGTAISREAVEKLIEKHHPDRFSPATLKSVAQNINSTLTQSGHLVGRVKKSRQQAGPTAGSLAYALLLSFATGARGPELFRTLYVRAQDVHVDVAMQLAEDAARRGWLHFKRVGDVMEVRFPQLINDADMEIIREQS